MQRKGRSANRLSRPSDECSSAGLNSIDVHRGHWCRIQSRWGNQVGQFQPAVLILIILSAESQAVSPFRAPECKSSNASKERMLPMAIAMQESAAPQYS